MRHKKAKYMLNNRFTSWRKATLNGLVRNLLIHQSIRTTKSKARALKPLAEKVISLGKANTLSAKRAAYKILGDHRLVSVLFSDIAPRFENRAGGFIRIYNLSRRRGDNAEMAIIELTEIKKKERKIVKKEKAARPQSDAVTPASQEEAKPKTDTAVKGQRPPITQKPPKKFLGGIKNIFKKERDSL